MMTSIKWKFIFEKFSRSSLNSSVVIEMVIAKVIINQLFFPTFITSKKLPHSANQHYFLTFQSQISSAIERKDEEEE